jgi:hypothetical protein
MHRNERLRLTAYNCSGVNGWNTERKSRNDINGDAAGDGSADCDSNANPIRNSNGPCYPGRHCDLPGSLTVHRGPEWSPTHKQRDGNIPEHEVVERLSAVDPVARRAIPHR